MTSLLSSTVELSVRPIRGLNLLVDSFSKAGYLFRIVLAPAELLIRVFAFFITGIIYFISFILAIVGRISGMFSAVYVRYGKNVLQGLGWVSSLSDSFEEKYIEDSQFFDRNQTLGYIIKVLWYILKHLFKRFIGLLYVLANTVLPLCGFLIIIAVFITLVWPALFFESNLDKGVSATVIIIKSFIDVMNFIFSAYNVVARLLNPFVNHIQLLIGFLVRVSFLWSNAMLETAGLASYRDRDLMFVMDSTQHSMVNHHYFHSRALATNYFFAYDEERKRSIKAGPKLEGIVPVLNTISIIAYSVFTVIFEFSLIMQELFLAWIFPIFSGFFVLVSGPVRSGTCCSANLGCCFRETTAGVIGSIPIFPGGGDAIRCKSGSFGDNPDICKCGTNQKLVGNSNAAGGSLGFYKFAPQCRGDLYYCEQDSEGYWEQFKSPTILDGETTVPTLIGVRSQDKRLACPHQVGALTQDAADLRNLVEAGPSKPSSECSSFCYPYKHRKKQNKGWLIQRCMDEDHLTMLGICGEKGRLLRRLDIEKDLAALRNHLKEFKKQYSPHKSVINSKKHLSNRQKRIDYLHQVAREKKEKKEEELNGSGEKAFSDLTLLKSLSTYNFPSQYFPLDGDFFLNQIVYDQMQLINSGIEHLDYITAKPKTEDGHNEKSNENLDYLFNEKSKVVEVSKSPVFIHRVLGHLLDFADNVEWTAKHGTTDKYNAAYHFDQLYSKIVDSHRTYMWDSHGIKSNVGEIKPYYDLAVRQLSKTTPVESRKRRKLATKYNPTEVEDPVTLGVFGKSCERMCPDLLTCVTADEYKNCPGPSTVISYLLYPFWWVQVFSIDFDFRYLLDTAYECWNNYEANPDTNPLTVTNMAKIMDLDQETPMPDSLSQVVFCFPLFPYIPYAPLISWDPEQYIIDKCGEEFTLDGENIKRCSCPQFPPAKQITNYKDKVLIIEYEYQAARIEVFYWIMHYFAAISFSWALDWWWYDLFSLFFLPDKFTMFFNVDHALQGLSHNGMLLCIFINLSSVFSVCMLLLYPIWTFHYNGLYKWIVDVCIDVFRYVLKPLIYLLVLAIRWLRKEINRFKKTPPFRTGPLREILIPENEKSHEKKI